MFDNLNEFLFKISMVIMFVAAISLFIYMQKTNDTLLKMASEHYIDDKNIYEMEDSNNMHIVKGSEIIVAIISGLEYDIEIEGYLIDKSIDYKDLNLNLIDSNKRYKRELVINNVGDIEKIVYKD